MSSKKTARCIDCTVEFSDAEIEGKTVCPSCGSKAVPSSISQDVTIKINWHELRILTIWASNWAQQHHLSLGAIISRLEAQRPNGDFAPLTLLGEVKEMAQVLGTTVELKQGAETTVIEPKPKN